MADRLRRTIERRLAYEVGEVRKDHGGRLRVCLVYPNTYGVGMSSLGFQTIYHLLNSDAQVVCERAFVPDREDLADLTRTGSAVVSYESQTPLGQFDLIAFSVSYELDYTGVARMLRLARVPTMAEQRGEEHPLVVAGGAAVSINPEPIADLVDAFVIGEGEEAAAELTAVLRVSSQRREALSGLDQLDGVYVPARDKNVAPTGPGRDGDVAPTGTRRDKNVARAGDGVSASTGVRTVTRRYVKDLDAWPTHSRVLTRESEFGDLFLVEVSRGCGRACRFCVTPSCYWPLRWRDMNSVLESARPGMEHRNAIGLVGSAVSDHPQIDEIATRVVGMGARLSVSSLRADSVSDALIRALATSGVRSITIAPEAGSERLRDAIGKGIADDEVLDALARASAAGMTEAKLYFMVGLPGETEKDVQAIPAFVRRCIRAAGLSRVTVAAGAFVPKPDTPYEAQGMPPAAELARRLRAVRDELRRERRVRLALESANWGYIEGALSRGDRRLGRVIAAAEEYGGNLAAWRRAFAEADLAPGQFAGPPGDGWRRPWGFIQRGERI
jgi:radical SAM superfamily enzyme YgiQ (UPF0313 family)